MSFYRDHNARRHRAALEAAEWMLRLQDPKVTRSERAEYVEWLRESPLHVAEMLRVSHVHTELSDFPFWSEIAPLEVASPGASVLELPGVRIPPSRESRRVRGLRFRPYLTALAAAIAILGVALAYFGDFRYETLNTGPGERRTLTLADGSVVGISPETTLRVHFTRNERYVRLSRGEALFRVAKDAAKPFVVETNRTRVRAVGTAFGVEHRDDSVIVTVEEGRVAVTQAPTEPSSTVAPTRPAPEISLDADQQIIVPPGGSLGPVHKVDSRRQLAWADGHLVFDHESVAEVVQQFNRFNRIQIKVLDPQVATRRVSAVFNVQDPEAFVTFLESVANVRVTHPARNTIVIESGAT
jgi:transmembrane sensor